MNAAPQGPPGLTPVGHFAPHGAVHVSLAPGFTLSHVTGPWNRELVKEWMAAFGRLGPQLTTLGPHAGITEISGSALATADALALMRVAVAHSVEKNQLKACAIVAAPKVVGQVLAATMFAPVFAGLTPYRAFTTMDEARAWCQRELQAAALP